MWRRRRGAGSPVERVNCGGAEVAGLRTRIARSPASACWRVEQQTLPKTHGHQRWRVCTEEAANARHRSRTTDGHLGWRSDAIWRRIKGPNDPPPAGEVLGAAIRPAASSRNPAAHTSRASARRPGSGIHAHGSQLARGGGRVPARCQRGAAVGHWTLASIAVSRLFPGARGLKSGENWFLARTTVNIWFLARTTAIWFLARTTQFGF